MNYPLADIKILSLAEQYPGPYATLILSDLGADVILVERPSGGDPARQFPAFFESLNRNKRSVALDLKSEEGRSALLRLVQDADVFLEGFRPGTMERIGFGYEAVSAVNRRIVYASISGFGQDGPYRDRPAHDLSYQATAGMLHEFAESGRTGPLSQLATGDLSSGMFAAIAVLVGLLTREKTGEGSYIDVSMTDGLVSWMTSQLVPVMNSTGPAGVLHEPGYGIYRTADGKLISLSIAHEDYFWQSLCRVLGMEDVASLRGSERLERRDELTARMEKALVSRPRDEWVGIFDAEGIPFGPVYQLEEVPGDPHVKARQLIVELPPNGLRPARRHVRQPIRMKGFEDGPRRHAPELGEHTQEVLRGAGFSEKELKAMFESKAAFDSSSSPGT